MKNMKKIIQPVFYISALLLVISCNKQLDLKPTDDIDVSKAFTSVKDLEQGLLGVYSANDNLNRIYIGSLLADEVKLSNENRGQGQFEYKWQYSASLNSTNNAYPQYYSMIDRLHRVLEAMDAVPAANATEEATKRRIAAELTALRGIAHFELLIRFMPSGYDANALGIPIMLKSDLAAAPARNTVGEVISQVEQDLAAGRAEAAIPTTPANPIRLSQAAIAAYQARVALLKRDWGGAVVYANDAITLSGKSLATGSDYVDFWSDDNQSETIFSYRNRATPQLLWRDTNGDVFFEPSDELKDLFDKVNDIRFGTYFSSAGADTSIIIKYPGSSTGPQINDLKLVRLSEMYLVRAEAQAENNQLVAAADDINALRDARIENYVPVTFASKDQAINEILTERYKELAYEGFRFFDLKRRGLAVSRLSRDVQSSTWQNLPANDFHFSLPIPQDEIFSNPNMVQNQGY